MGFDDRKAMLIRVGIDKSSDGVLSPIFHDGSFEYIPLSEKNKSTETRTYQDIVGIKGKKLSEYLSSKVSSRKVHFDPEFRTFTYGDEGRKAKILEKLKTHDLLVFYAGLTPFTEGDMILRNEYSEALYIIGYFTVLKVVNLSIGSNQIRSANLKFPTNSHLKRCEGDEIVLVIGDPGKSKLLEKGILISHKKLNTIGRTYHAVSPLMEELLGIKGSIQRSIPPRIITDSQHLDNLGKLLGS